MGCTSSDLKENSKYLTPITEYIKEKDFKSSRCGICFNTRSCKSWDVKMALSGNLCEIKCSCDDNNQWVVNNANSAEIYVCKKCHNTRYIGDPRNNKIYCDIYQLEKTITEKCTTCNGSGKNKLFCGMCRGIGFIGKQLCFKCGGTRYKYCPCDSCISIGACHNYIKVLKFFREPANYHNIKIEYIN